MSDATWSVLLLALRVAVCLALYLFLLAAFRTLRAELRGRAGMSEPATAPLAPPGVVTERPPAPTAPVPPLATAAAMQPAEEATVPPALAVETERVSPAARRAARRRGTVAATPLRNALIVVLPLLLIGGAVVLAARERANETDLQPPAQSAGTPAPPVHVSGRVTVGLTAQEDSGVRVTVDSVVQFSGVLRAGQQQRWEGASRIQVWTDKGRTLLLSVNGNDLGPYSPAMGHPEWNRIDFAFAPSWRPSRNDNN